ncbi:MAG: ATP-dependent sacrificial sulfur transferase LarE [Endomicrobiales bacterium]
MNNKQKCLEGIIGSYGKVLIAFSGGVDSTYLLAIARRVLGKKNVLAVTAISETYPAAELVRARQLARELDVSIHYIKTDELRNASFKNNPPDRCFFCKNELFAQLDAIARKRHMIMCDGTNASDAGDYRPGRRAARKWKVVSPLAEAAMTKDDIRRLSKRLKLPTWNMPAQACLASRFPYGTTITIQELAKVEKTEVLLKSYGFDVIRVRNHGDLARIEVEPRKIRSLMKILADKKILAHIKQIGWRFVTVDVSGYTMGCFNQQ